MEEPIVQLLELELLGENPAPYASTYRWRMRLQSQAALPEPISVSFVWVGSSSSSAYDQTLDSFDVGPLQPGLTECELECDAPQLELVPPEEAVGVTLLILSFQYKSQEFLRVGYYTQVAYFDAHLNQCPPPQLVKEALGRFVAMPQPAVTVVPIKWN